jgi:hypothetical protein
VRSGDRTSRDRETHSAVPGKTNPESRWSKVNFGECPLATRTLPFRLPEYRIPISCEHATWTPLRLRGPTLPRPLRDFADRGILSSESPTAGNPECRTPDALDSCHLSLLESTVPIRSGIALRDFNVHGILHSPTRFTDADGQGFPSFFPRSNDSLDFAGLHDGSVRRFSSSMKRPPLRHLPSVRLVRFLQRTEEAILPELRPPTPSENFHEPCTPFQLKHSPSVEVLLGPVHSRLKRLNPLLLRLSTETRLRPALTGTARITRPNSGRSENKGSTA